MPTRINNVKVVVKFLRENILTIFGMPQAITSDQGSYFTNRSFDTLLKRYSILHRLTTPNYLQTSGQVELSNRHTKQILKKTRRRN